MSARLPFAPIPASPRSRRGLKITAPAAAAILILSLLPAFAPAAAASPIPPRATEGTDAPSAGLPPEAPPAAFVPEPTLPVPTGWTFSDDFSRTSGTSRLDAGALLWTDWLYDDTGAGNFTYADDAAASNGADVFRAAVAVDQDATHWRVDWNSLPDVDVPIAVWTFDTDGDPATGAAEWPAGAGATSPGMESALIVSAGGVRLVDLVSGESIDVVATGGGGLTVDPDARSFVASIPRTVLPVEGTWTVRLASGVADDGGDGFAPAPESGDGTRIYNAAFRTVSDEPHLVGGFANASTQWNNGRQTERLREGDMSDFFLDVEWSRLLEGEVTQAPDPRGYSTRWYVSTADLGQGMTPGARRSPGPGLLPATFLGRVQPYTVYVPTGYEPGTPTPLTLLLHAGDANHNGFAGDRRDDVYGPMCEERGSICVTPLARGLSTWYLDEAELDVWEVWNRMSHAYTLDPDATVIGGFSMGGVGATRFATNHPQLFAGLVVVSGAGYYNTLGVRDREGSELRTENLRTVPMFIDSGSADVALANTRRWDAAADAADVPYRAHYYEGADHGMLGAWLGWSDAADYIADIAPRQATPAEFSFRWEPGDERADLGMPVDRVSFVRGLHPRDENLRWSRVNADRGGERAASLTDAVVSIDGRNVQVRDQRVERTGAIDPHALDLTLENVGALTLELDSTGLPADGPTRIRVQSDGATEVRLVRGERSHVVTLGAGETILRPAAASSVSATASDGAARVSWTAARGVPTDISTDASMYVVRDAAGEVVCETTATTCRVDGLANGEMQRFDVTRIDLLGTSTPVRSLWVTPGPAPAQQGVSLTVAARVVCDAGIPAVRLHVTNKERVAVDVRVTPASGARGAEEKIRLAAGGTFARVLPVADTAAETEAARVAGYRWEHGVGGHSTYDAGYDLVPCQ